MVHKDKCLLNYVPVATKLTSHLANLLVQRAFFPFSDLFLNEMVYNSENEELRGSKQLSTEKIETPGEFVADYC